MSGRRYLLVLPVFALVLSACGDDPKYSDSELYETLDRMEACNTSVEAFTRASSSHFDGYTSQDEWAAAVTDGAEEGRLMIKGDSEAERVFTLNGSSYEEVEEWIEGVLDFCQAVETDARPMSEWIEETGWTGVSR